MTLTWKLSAPLTRVLSLIALVAFSASAAATQIQLQNGTATFSQDFNGVAYNPGMAIDGIFYTGDCCISNGWTIARAPGTYTTAETAVWQTVSDVGRGSVAFTMLFLDPNGGHLLGRFRWSVTTDDRSTYADGLPIGGNVTANWTVLTNPMMQLPPGMTFTVLPDDSILMGGTVPGQGLYKVTYQTNLAGITGIRLEVLKDPGLPGSGPGFFFNGNFVLTELQLTAGSTTIPVAIDIRPGSFPNRINFNSDRVVPVAILSTPTFNVVDVDVNSVKFAGASAEKVTYDDANSDGLTDLVFYFRTQDLQLTPSSTQATLTGNLRNGTPITGTDSVKIVPLK